MPLRLPDRNRQPLQSIDPASDLCRKWVLWGRGDYIDSVICCHLFRDRHPLTDGDMAKALATLHKQCAGMTAQDVAELYRFLETHPGLHTNGIRQWQGIKAGDGKSKADEAKVALAIARFRNQIPKAL